MRIGRPGRARLSLVRQSPLLTRVISFQSKGPCGGRRAGVKTGPYHPKPVCFPIRMRSFRSRPGSSCQPRMQRTRPEGWVERSGCRRHLELVGQLADLGFWVAAMATKGLEERQPAFCGPAGHGLGRHVQEVGHLGGMEVAGRVGDGRAVGLGCHRAFPFRAADPEAGPGPDGPSGRPATKGEGGPATMLGVTLLPAVRTRRSWDRPQVPAIVRLGRFRAPVPSPGPARTRRADAGQLTGCPA
jgi:hypothetical protein